MKLRAWDEKNLRSIRYAVRTAVAATVSVIIARLVQMPEAYWAAIATFGRHASTLGATLTLSLERIVATAVGASATRLLHFGKERRLALTHNDTGKPIFATRAL